MDLKLVVLVAISAGSRCNTVRRDVTHAEPRYFHNLQIARLGDIKEAVEGGFAEVAGFKALLEAPDALIGGAVSVGLGGGPALGPLL